MKHIWKQALLFATIIFLFTFDQKTYSDETVITMFSDGISVIIIAISLVIILFTLPRVKNVGLFSLGLKISILGGIVAAFKSGIYVIISFSNPTAFEVSIGFFGALFVIIVIGTIVSGLYSRLVNKSNPVIQRSL